MDYAQKESEANSRILAAVQFLADQHGLDSPAVLTSVSGNVQERRVKRLLAVAGFLELLALESIQAGLAEKFAAYGFTSLADLRKASLEDLQVVEGIGKKSAENIHKALTGGKPEKVEPFVYPDIDEDDLLVGDAPSIDEMLEELDE
jgi:DNA integrity scanning protein DisA with diadenylate cyclase activity